MKYLLFDITGGHSLDQLEITKLYGTISGPPQFGPEWDMVELELSRPEWLGTKGNYVWKFTVPVTNKYLDGGQMADDKVQYGTLAWYKIPEENDG